MWATSSHTHKIEQHSRTCSSTNLCTLPSRTQAQRTASFIVTVGVRHGRIKMKDQERDVLRRTILELIKKGHVHYTDIEKKACATCLRFATTSTIRKQFYHYLLLNDYVERVSRGIYRITSKGEKLSEILS